MSKLAQKKKIVSKPTTLAESEVAQKTPRTVRTQRTRKLALLKAQTFTEKGREQRIAAALAALNAPQPTDLTLSQWKEIAEEVEEEA